MFRNIPFTVTSNQWYEPDFFSKSKLKNPNFKFWENEMYNLKKESLKNLSNGAIVSPSQWLLDEALKVDMFSNFKIQT